MSDRITNTISETQSSPTEKSGGVNFKILWRLLFAILLACLWVLLSATPVFAQANTINYSNTDLKNRDFSGMDFVGGTFVAADMRGIDFRGSDLSNAIFTKGVLLGENLEGANLTGALIDRVTLDNANLKCDFNGSDVNSDSLF